ncbi:MAG TPA: molybdenum ABC transporter ATP-binding protein [Xanthobacteraceae bacterium]|nr:molybdenum ABC transporter ATP-binding protein [Xanthobacteraceae bacterium]
MLDVDVEKRLGAFSIAAKFKAKDGVTALFGPSGSGKTTIINMIAGLVTPDRGRLIHDGNILFDKAAGIDVPPGRRRFGYVFQDGRLFPHLSVRSNLDYGRRMCGLAPDQVEFDRIVGMLDIAHLVKRRPGHLSGGERQRVAIGRALLMRPRLLMLDEPLASLDVQRKAEIMPFLERLRDEAKVPMIYVSHHAAEIRRLATSVIRVEGGRIITTGGLELLETVSSDLLA